MPRRTELTHAQVLAASQLTFRDAKAAFHISHGRWKAINEAGGFEDRQGDNGSPARSDELTEKLVESVREKPHPSESLHPVARLARGPPAAPSQQPSQGSACGSPKQGGRSHLPSKRACYSPVITATLTRNGYQGDRGISTAIERLGAGVSESEKGPLPQRFY